MTTLPNHRPGLGIGMGMGMGQRPPTRSAEVPDNPNIIRVYSDDTPLYGQPGEGPKRHIYFPNINDEGRQYPSGGAFTVIQHSFTADLGGALGNGPHNLWQIQTHEDDGRLEMLEADGTSHIFETRTIGSIKFWAMEVFPAGFPKVALYGQNGIYPDEVGFFLAGDMILPHENDFGAFDIPSAQTDGFEGNRAWYRYTQFGNIRFTSANTGGIMSVRKSFVSNTVRPFFLTPRPTVNQEFPPGYTRDGFISKCVELGWTTRQQPDSRWVVEYIFDINTVTQLPVLAQMDLRRIA